MRLSVLVALFLGVSVVGGVAAYVAAVPDPTEPLAVRPAATPASEPALRVEQLTFTPVSTAKKSEHKQWITGDSLEAMRDTRTQQVDPTPPKFAPGGLYHVDTFAFTGKGVRGTFNAEATVDTAGTLELVGWAIDTVRKNSGQTVELVFASRDEMKILPTEREERVDLVNVYNQEGYRHSGFIARTTVESFKAGEYKIFVRLTCSNGAGCQQHDTGRKLSILPPQPNEEEF